MQPPPPGPYPGAAPAGNDRSTLYGAIGIPVGLICCGPAGIVLGILSMQEAKKYGKQPTLGYISIAVGVIGVIWSVLYWTVIRK
jgi:hypothetical protein